MVGKTKKKAKEEEQKFEVYKLEDGTTVSKFCMEKFADQITNQETLWDVLDVVTKLTRLDIVKDENGFVTDVILIQPRIDEVVALMAIKNFQVFSEMVANGLELTPEALLEQRRFKLQKMIEDQ